MSQIYKNTLSVPPTIPTQFTADDSTIAVPEANNLNDFTSASVETNNTRGLQSTAIGSTMIYQLTNRVSVSTTTSDGAGQTQTVVLITPTNSTSLTFRCLITGYDSADNLSVGGEQIGLVRKLAGTVVVVGTNDTFAESDVALIAADWNVIQTSPTLSIQFIGVAGKTINWRALFDYTQAP